MTERAKIILWGLALIVGTPLWFWLLSTVGWETLMPVILIGFAIIMGVILIWKAAQLK